MTNREKYYRGHQNVDIWTLTDWILDDLGSFGPCDELYGKHCKLPADMCRDCIHDWLEREVSE